MDESKKLDRWAEKLLDIGKRNNLINFKDTKSSSAEVLFPECEAFFPKCSIGRTFEVYDPQIADNDELEDDGDQPNQDEEKKLAEVKKHMEVNDVPDKQPFKDAVKPVYDQTRKQFGNDIFDKIAAAAK